MKSLVLGALLTSMVALTGCSTPAPANDATEPAVAANTDFEDKGEVLTGSRIPQKSTTHTLRRVGSAEYKKGKMESTSSGMAETPPKW